MDFMDADMKAIARKGYEKAGAVLLNGWALWVYAACEAVLAEQKRRQAQQSTEQEIVTTVLKKWADADDAEVFNELTPSEVAAKILAALGKGGK